MLIEDFRSMVESIPVLSDEKVKRGEFDHIDEHSVIHFFIYPFLNTLGYNVFNPEELKLNFNKDGYEADVVIFKDGEPLSVFKLVDLDDELDRSVFTEDDVYGLRNLGASLVVLTNGLDYVLYSFIDDVREEFFRFTLDSLDDESADKVYKVLSKDILAESLENDNFFTEKIIDSKFGKLNETNYLMRFVKDELVNPSDRFINILADSITDRYITDMSSSDIAEKLREEFEDNSGILFERNVGSKSDLTNVNKDEAEEHKLREEKRQAKASAEKKLKEEEERLAKEAEEKAKEERIAREEADRKAKEEKERLATEAEEKAKEERIAREEADRKAKEEKERLAKEAEEKAKEERIAREEAELREDEERKAKIAAEKKAKRLVADDYGKVIADDKEVEDTSSFGSELDFGEISIDVEEENESDEEISLDDDEDGKDLNSLLGI